MIHLINRNGRFYFNRRIPKKYREFDSRTFVRIALHTDSRSEAIRLATLQNLRLEAYWKELAIAGCKLSETYYTSVVNAARLMGLSYMPSAAIAQLPPAQIVERVSYLDKSNLNEKTVQVVLGGVNTPVIRLDGLLSKYWGYSKPRILNKSPHQVRKWKNPRIKAIRNLIKVVGNKAVSDLTREDMLLFRNWWFDRLDKNNMTANSANKDITFCKVIVEAVCENLKLPLDVQHLFRKLSFETKDDDARRLPFDTKYITDVLLNPANLKGLEEQAKWLLHAFAETGAGISELVGLLPEDISLNDEIPHIAITPRKHTGLKTKYRKRTIPLVGHALDAFRACPEGFFKYRANPDILSTTLNKYLREKNLMPSEMHSVYSLRHSFQDRLLAANVPDRIQAQLMGHKFGRPSYGEGGTLAQKKLWMNLVKLKQT